jgi:hypothetical protein
MVEQAAVRVLDDGVVTKRSAADDEEVDRLSIAISRRVPAEMPVQPCGRDDSICLLVQIDMDTGLRGQQHSQHFQTDQPPGRRPRIANIIHPLFMALDSFRLGCIVTIDFRRLVCRPKYDVY